VALELHDLTVSYHRKPVLWNVDLAVPRGKLVGIIGPNGAGKSTLIKAVMGLLPLSSGWVQVFGQSVERMRQKIGDAYRVSDRRERAERGRQMTAEERDKLRRDIESANRELRRR
jgi:ABC-type Mn2+/Zn2+ transport system ATPase subunit